MSVSHCLWCSINCDTSSNGLQRWRGAPLRFRGYYDHAALISLKLGPKTLKERIASLGGSLAINSTDSGARLEITLPLVRNGS